MLRKLSLLALLGIFVGGCVSSRNVRREDDPSSHSWITSDRAVMAAGLRPLRSTHLKSGQREIRVWVAYSFPGVGNGTFYRLTKRGSKVGGDVFFYWSKEERDEHGRVYWTLESRDSTRLVNQFEGRCDQFKASEEMQTCHAKFVTLPNWQDVLAQLEAHHVWTLPNMNTLRWHSARRFVVNDGYGMVVEVRDGDAYRSYEYDNPDSYIKEWPEEAGDAVAIVGAVHSVHAYIVPEKKR